VDWQPHTLVTEEHVQPGPVTALARLLDDGTPAPGDGDVLPPLWHWVALPQWPAASGTGSDGHPHRGTFLPPVPLPRRMFAGGEVRLHAPLRVGGTARRESTVLSVTEKAGRSGPMVLVTVADLLYDERGTLAIEERRDLIFREGGTPGPSPATANPLPVVGSPIVRSGPWEAELRTDPTVLLRFSAATANGHRIHYDWPYATTVEGYPGLVVHGPLMTLALAEMLRLEVPDRRVTRLVHRNRQPLFCGQLARIRRTSTADGQPRLALLGEPSTPGDERLLTSLDVELGPVATTP
jgi:3-methylfumaryl-CoA hydratase